VRFPRSQGKADGQPRYIDDDMNFARESTSRPAHQLFFVACNTAPMLVHTHNGRIDHLHGCVMSAGQ
jgi:hypothetical protein